MLAEHGALGVLACGFVALGFVSGKQFQHVLCCALSLLVLTINHAAMRTAVPALYSLGFIERAMGTNRKVSDQ
jgi:hypothetical protein